MKKALKARPKERQRELIMAQMVLDNSKCTITK